MLRKIFCQRPKSIRFLQASFSRSFSDLTITNEADSKVSVITMHKSPVNSLSLETLTELREAISEVEGNRKCQGLILTSSLPRIFCAGLDILEMYNPEQERLRAFWSTLQDVWVSLNNTRLATVAAINGNSPAGGCLLSLCCDYRIMADGKYAIGLNETKLGIVAPFWFQLTMVDVIGHRETEKALMLGHMYSNEEALKVGMIDKIVAENALMDSAKEELERWLKIPGMARGLTKLQLRHERVGKLLAVKEDDIDNFVNFVSSPAVQKGLGAYMENLKKKAQA